MKRAATTNEEPAQKPEPGLSERIERDRMVRAEALAEARLLELRRIERERELIARIAAARPQASEAEIHKAALAELCGFTGWDVGRSYMAQGANEVVKLKFGPAWHRPESARFMEFLRAGDALEFALDGSLAARALSQGAPAWDLDAAWNKEFPLAELALRAGLTGAFAFPILSGKIVVAVLEFYAARMVEPDAPLLALLSQTGLQLGRLIEHRRAEDTLREWAETLMRARDEAKAADRAKSVFLANMSHELRTPLNAIIGFSEILARESFGPIDSRYREYAGHIHASGNRLLDTINAVLDLSKLDADSLELSDQWVKIGDLIVGCLDTLAPLAQIAKLNMSVMLDAGLPQLRGDEKRLRQVVTNLVSNAIKFTPEGGEVRVRGGLRDRRITIVITDTGIGMAEDEIPRALEPFGQVDGRLARKYEGSGLGLPLARHLVELHGGRLTIESERNEGTEVTLSFPEYRTGRTTRAG